MLLKRIYDDKLAEAAYLIGCQRTGEAIIIDPERDVDRYILAAKNEGLRLVAATETHIHADFLSGCRELAERGLKVYLSDEGDSDWKYQWLDKRTTGGSYDHQLLHHGDTFRVGGIEFKALHTPGHTPEHICFMVTDRGGGANEPMGVATGDFVFVGDVGRPDLLESAAGTVGAADVSARRLYSSIRGFSSWPDYLQVWPAHGSGSACGKALGAVPQTTVGYEKRFSPAIRSATSEDEFVSFILEGQPEPPLYFARMKRDNKSGPRVLGALPQPARLDAAELRSIDTGKSVLIDTRAWDEFRKGHIPGSLYVPANNSFTTDVGSFVDEESDIRLLIDPAKVDAAVRDLVRIGLDRVVGWCPPSVIEEYRAAGGKLASIAEVGADEARELVQQRSPFILDVRRKSEFDEGHIEGATCIAHTRIASRMHELPRDRELLVHCRSGARSARTCALLQRVGFRVTNLAGGFLEWEKMPIRC